MLYSEIIYQLLQLDNSSLIELKTQINPFLPENVLD